MSRSLNAFVGQLLWPLDRAVQIVYLEVSWGLGQGQRRAANEMSEGRKIWETVMYTKQALRELGVTGDEFTEEHREALDRDGFFVVPDYYTPEQCRQMAVAFDGLHAAEGDQGGHEVQIEPGAPRVSNIFNKTEAYDTCLECKPLLAAAHYLLGEYKIHGANLRNPLKGQGHQELHVDVPKRFADDWWVINALILFDDMTLSNGPTRVIPGSHRWPPINVPSVNRADWEPEPLSAEEQAMVPEDLEAAHPKEMLVTAPAGAVVIVNSALWHSGTRNEDGSRRRVLHLTYTRRDLPQQLTQRDYLTESLYQRMSPPHRFLMDIEPLADGEQVVRQQPKGAESRNWWN
ncbi:MAG: phytanoyl-CoA dioxygenase family protein [Pseudomonadota bacterium]